MDDDQWGEVVDLALHNGLAPMLNWVLKGAGINLESASLWTPLVSAARSAALRYALLDTTRVQIDTAMRDANIPTIWLKGIALAHSAYPEPWLRPMSDLDVLVPHEQRNLALTTVESLGFRHLQNPNTLIIDVPEDLQHHYVFYATVANSVCLELHHRLLGTFGLELLPREQLDWFWENSYIWTNDSTTITIFKPEPELLYLCAHTLLQHGEANTSLFCYFDLHLLITKTALDWQMVVDKALELKWSYAVERTLTLAIQFFKTQVPEWVLDQLRTRRSIDEDSFRVTRLQGKGNRWESEMMFLSKLPFAARLRIITTMLFPKKKFIQDRYSIPPGQPVLPYYFYRWFDAGLEVVWSTRNRFTRFINKY